MVIIQPTLEVPERIFAGLATGSLERVGGVIVESRSKQIVMWLRDVSQLDDAAQKKLMMSSGVLSSKSFSLLMTGAAMLNTVMLTFHLGAMLKRFTALGEKIDDAITVIKQEFEKDRDVQLVSALRAAEDAFEAQHADNRRERATQAIHKFDIVHEHIKRRFIESLDNQPLHAKAHLILGMWIDNIRTRCYLEIGEHDTAKKRLHESIKLYRSQIEALIHHLFGNPARYFHKDVADEDFQRFIKIESWLRGNTNALEEIVLEYRQDFWNKDVLPRQGFNLGAFLSRSSEEEDAEPPHLEALTVSELMIENLSRLQGFHEEIAALSSGFLELEAQIGDTDAPCLVNEDVLHVA
ncbi:MAG: hypothetical protein D6712_00175 [Chloroflexi bacterium]|nr:MAG: hypothetical protein D6712_00175 [Chloroflexota bacterium]